MQNASARSDHDSGGGVKSRLSWGIETLGRGRAGWPRHASTLARAAVKASDGTHRRPAQRPFSQGGAVAQARWSAEAADHLHLALHAGDREHAAAGSDDRGVHFGDTELRLRGFDAPDFGEKLRPRQDHVLAGAPVCSAGARLVAPAPAPGLATAVCARA